jgi:YD repeat-containing protein
MAAPTTGLTDVLQSGSSIYNTSTSVADGYGRNASVTQNDSAGNDTVTTTYDADGRVHSVTNPERGSPTSTDGTTTINYDAANRKTAIIEADGSQVTYNYTSAAGFVIVTDEQGKQRKLGYTGGGASTGVVYEPDSTGAFTLLTQSGIDEAGHVTSISQQGGGASSQYRNRMFFYDTAGRLTSSTTPEQGNITYGCVTSGGALCSGSLTAICTRTDARGKVTTYTYDTLNRPTGKTYSPGTPAVSYNYDESSANGMTIANGAGQRTSMTDGSGTSAWSFDPVGRPVSDKRTINGVTKTAAYSYNLDGTLATQQDFLGNTLNYGYTNTSSLLSVTDAATSLAIVSGVAYTPVGTTAGETLGNGVVLTNMYNQRAQVASLGASKAGTQLLGLSYTYGTAAQDNGNISQVTNTLDSTRTQNFTYDWLNRISTAQEGTRWGDSYGYDNFGEFVDQDAVEWNGWGVGVTDAQHRASNK